MGQRYKNNPLLVSAAALVSAIVIAASATAHAQQSEWAVGQWKGEGDAQITFGMGEQAFADNVTDYNNQGDADLKFTDVEDALGPPDHEDAHGEGGGHYLTLGCGGSAVFHFIDNVLVDQDGPDLFVFEQGWNEPTQVAIRANGSWYEVGKITGGITGLDIGRALSDQLSPAEVAGLSFDAVRLTDQGKHCQKREYRGADIDAVGAIASRPQWHIRDANFAFDSDLLGEKTRGQLPTILEAFPPNGVAEIRGHTDSLGSDAYNRNLSLRRARAVSLELQRLGLSPTRICLKAFGERLPIATNETSEGRAANRRVEVRFLDHCTT